MGKDYYKVLGVAKGAEGDELKKGEGLHVCLLLMHGVQATECVCLYEQPVKTSH
jgi:hypothetical protein